MELLSGLPPSMSHIAGLVEGALVDVDDALTFGDESSEHSSRILTLLFGLDGIGKNIASIDLLVRHAEFQAQDLSDGGDADIYVEMVLYVPLNMFGMHRSAFSTVLLVHPSQHLPGDLRAILVLEYSLPV